MGGGETILLPRINAEHQGKSAGRGTATYGLWGLINGIDQRWQFTPLDGTLRPMPLE